MGCIQTVSGAYGSDIGWERGLKQCLRVETTKGWLNLLNLLNLWGDSGAFPGVRAVMDDRVGLGDGPTTVVTLSKLFPAGAEEPNFSF